MKMADVMVKIFEYRNMIIRGKLLALSLRGSEKLSSITPTNKYDVNQLEMSLML